MNTGLLNSIILAAVLLAAPSAVMAQGDEAGAEANASGGGAIYQEGGLAGIGLVAGIRANAGFGSVLGGVGTGFGGELELGYILPALNRSLEIFATGRYEAGFDSGSGTDNRLDGADWSYELDRRQGIVSLGGLYRLDIGPGWLAPYGAIGGRMYLWQAEITGESGGENYGTYTETATDFGGFLALGADFFVGPGSILVEVQADYGPVDGFVLRETNAGALSTLLGYRFFL